MKLIKRIRSSDEYDQQIEAKFQIYTRPYMGFTDLAKLLDVSAQTAKRLVIEANQNKVQIRRFQRIGMPTSDIVKAFGLEANRKQIMALRASK